MKFHDYVVALEEVARADASVGLTMASHNSLCTGHIFLAGNEAQRQRYLPRLASGQVLGGWGLTEPGSGSDAGAAQTRAVRRETRGPDGSVKVEWVLNGTKTFITQGSVGSIYVILASTSPEKKAKGLTAFVVERGTPGFRAGKRIEKMGLHASDTTELILEDVVVPEDQRLGALDQGFFDTLKILEKGRIGIGAWAVGIGRAAYEAARAYAKQRVQFGQAIAEFQGVQFMLADMATELDAARLLVWRAAWLQDQGKSTARESSVAKYYAARAAMRACNAAIQIHGGYGYTREFPVERYLRDAKLAEIGEGTNEVQKLVIAREILKDVA
jgi:alkylation response protein AidB-like acyl-CoA dehydrogenase